MTTFDHVLERNNKHASQRQCFSNHRWSNIWLNRVFLFLYQAEPVPALRVQAPEVLAVALFDTSAVAAHLSKVYLSGYDHV